MSTKVVRVAECDRCGESATAPTATTLPAGWARLIRPAGAECHLCLACGRATEHWIKTGRVRPARRAA